MPTELNYKGYMIHIRQAGGYFAHVFRPGSNKPISEFPQATNQEGEAICIMKAKALVDREEEKEEAARQAKEKKD